MLEQYEHLTLAQIEKVAEKSRGCFGWKDKKDYSYLGGNAKMAELMQLSSPQELIGINDFDINWLPGGHTAEYFQDIDKQVTSGQRFITNEKEILLKNNKEGKVVTKVVIVTKRALVHNGIPLGVVLQGIEITHLIFPTLPQPKPIRDLENELFTPRENDCVTLLLSGCSYKQIAYKLNISVRTVEYYIENIKLKLHCPNKQTLIVKLMQMGYSSSL